MEGSTGFAEVLEEHLDKKKEHLDRTELPQLREKFRLFHSAYQGIYNILLRKGLVDEDPYKYDQKISEVTTPPESPFLESEKAEQLSVRMSEYDSQLEFLSNYYQFSVDFLDLKRVKNLVALTKYYRWEQLTATSTHLNTRILAEQLEKVKQGGDQVSASLIADSQNQLDKGSKAVLSALRSLALYHRERYKLELRRSLFQDMDLDAATVRANREEALKTVKRGFAARMGDRPFYPELAMEILNEDYAPEGEQLRGEILRRLAVDERKEDKQKQEVQFQQMLLEAIRQLSACSSHLSEAIQKITDNSTTLESRKVGLTERLKRWLHKVAFGEAKQTIYEVEYVDPVTSSTKNEKVNFQVFVEEAGRKSRLLAAVSVRSSSTLKRLANAGEEQIYTFLSRNLEDLQAMVRTMNGLDTYFKSEMSRDERSQLRGIKLELNAIKNSVVKANQKKHEYVSKKEEMEQMKRLGIKTDAV